jgi:hypothetical protein
LRLAGVHPVHGVTQRDALVEGGEGAELIRRMVGCSASRQPNGEWQSMSALVSSRRSSSWPPSGRCASSRTRTTSRPCSWSSAASRSTGYGIRDALWNRGDPAKESAGGPLHPRRDHDVVAHGKEATQKGRPRSSSHYAPLPQHYLLTQRVAQHISRPFPVPSVRLTKAAPHAHRALGARVIPLS